MPSIRSIGHKKTATKTIRTILIAKLYIECYNDTQVKTKKLSYQEWSRDWPDDARQPAAMQGANSSRIFILEDERKAC